MTKLSQTDVCRLVLTILGWMTFVDKIEEERSRARTLFYDWEAICGFNAPRKPRADLKALDKTFSTTINKCKGPLHFTAEEWEQVDIFSTPVSVQSLYVEYIDRGRVNAPAVGDVNRPAVAKRAPKKKKAAKKKAKAKRGGGRKRPRRSLIEPDHESDRDDSESDRESDGESDREGNHDEGDHEPFDDSRSQGLGNPWPGFDDMIFQDVAAIPRRAPISEKAPEDNGYGKKTRIRLSGTKAIKSRGENDDEEHVSEDGSVSGDMSLLSRWAEDSAVWQLRLEEERAQWQQRFSSLTEKNAELEAELSRLKTLQNQQVQEQELILKEKDEELKALQRLQQQYDPYQEENICWSRLGIKDTSVLFGMTTEYFNPTDQSLPSSPSGIYSPHDGILKVQMANSNTPAKRNLFV
jgi:hypothetical protein